MADVGFNGTTVSFASAPIVPLVSIEYSKAGDVPVPGAGDTVVYHEAGIPNETTTVEVEGGTTIAKGDTGALVVAWKDGGSKGSIASAIVLSSRSNGSVDNPVSSTIVFGNAA